MDETRLRNKATTTEILDFYLKYLSLKDILISPNSVTSAESDSLKIHTNITKEEILGKLILDGHVKCEKKEWHNAIKTLSGNPPVIRTYSITFNGRDFINRGGYKWKYLREYASVTLKYAISFAVSVASVLGAFYSCQQTNIQRQQLELQKKAQYQEEISKLILKELSKRQKLIDQLSKKYCPQPTVVVKNYIRQSK